MSGTKGEAAQSIARGLMGALGLAAFPFPLWGVIAGDAKDLPVLLVGAVAGGYALGGWPLRSVRLTWVGGRVPVPEWGARVAAFLGALWYGEILAALLGGSLVHVVYFSGWTLLTLAYALFGWSPLQPILNRLPGVAKNQGHMQ